MGRPAPFRGRARVEGIRGAADRVEGTGVPGSRAGERRSEGEVATAVPERTYGAPQQIQPTRLGDYLEVMSKAVFQTGISWRVVDAKWPGIREAFQNFDQRA